MVVERWPGAEEAMESQGNVAGLYMSGGDDANAAGAVERLLREYGKREEIAEAVEKVARQYSELGKQDEAAELFGYVLEHWPGSERAIWCRMGLVQSRIRQWKLDEAEGELGTLLSQFSSNERLGEVVHEIVEEYRNTGAHEESRELFNYLLEEWASGEGTLLELQVGVALQSVRLREPNAAEAAVELLIADFNEHPNIAKGLFQIAEQYFYALDYERCVRLLELIRRKYPEKEFESKPELPYMAAFCYKRLHDFEKAIENYGRCVGEYPSGKFSSSAAFDAGFVCMTRIEDYNQGVYWFEQQRRLYPGHVNVRGAIYRTGVCYERLEEYAKAAEAYEEYIAKYPGEVNVWASYASLGQCYAKLGEKEAALAILQEAYEKAGTEDLRLEFTRHIEALGKGGGQ